MTIVKVVKRKLKPGTKIPPITLKEFTKLRNEGK